VANRGIGSDVIKGFYHRLDKVIELDPKICFIEGGANDIEFGIDLDTSFHYLNIIIDSLSGAGIVPVVSCVIDVTKDYPGSTRFNLNAKAFNQKLNQFSQENMIDVIDLNPVIAPRGYLELEFAQSDGIHLTSNAYTIWKQMIQNKLRKYKI
jgi:lysophospholipase L1-like esterase